MNEFNLPVIHLPQFSFDWFVFTWRSAVSFCRSAVAIRSWHCDYLALKNASGNWQCLLLQVFQNTIFHICNCWMYVSELPPHRLSYHKGWCDQGDEGLEHFRLFLLWARSLLSVKKSLWKQMGSDLTCSTDSLFLIYFYDSRELYFLVSKGWLCSPKISVEVSGSSIWDWGCLGFSIIQERRNELD